MTNSDNSSPLLMSGPHPALKRLERPVGTWVLRGRTLDSNEDSITGTMTCEWLPGGFFLQQISELRFNELRAYSLEIISYDPKTNIFPATVYSSMSGTPLPYYWDAQENTVTHWTETRGYTGTFSKDGQTLSGGWRPIEGKNGVAYDAVMTRTESHDLGSH